LNSQLAIASPATAFDLRILDLRLLARTFKANR